MTKKVKKNFPKAFGRSFKIGGYFLVIFSFIIATFNSVVIHFNSDLIVDGTGKDIATSLLMDGILLLIAGYIIETRLDLAKLKQSLNIKSANDN